MQGEAQTKFVPPESLQRQHESGNPSIGGILIVAALVVLMMAGCLAIVWFTMVALERKHPGDQLATARGILTAPNLQMLQRFPAPNLQVNPPDDLVSFRARENAELNGYGWVDRTNGVVHIPIARAVELIAQRGLPARASNSPPRTGSSSLRLIEERREKR